MSWSRVFLGLALTLVVITAVWSLVIVSYESDLGTENGILVAQYNAQATNGSDDVLATLTFDEGGEALPWSSLQLQLEIDEESYGCTFGSQSAETDEASRVQPSLGADGQTFLTQVDATREEQFTYLDVPNQTSSNESDYTLRFSKTDVYMNDGIRWQFVEGESIENDFELDNTQFVNATEERLDWYTYDLSVHRVTPNDGVYVFEQTNQRYKIQFLTYYDDADEARYPTMLVSSLTPDAFPALNNPELVSPSPCLIVSEDADRVNWDADEAITLRENGLNICAADCNFSLVATFEGVPVRIVQSETSGA
ncbi:hypothetical protein [Candidatus Poseidonia alphae]|uniref:hypothetical protein n=1 Tax=Candidatus Poseidonia alphae TaxID=1915863 RepID=UPI0030C737F1